MGNHQAALNSPQKRLKEFPLMSIHCLRPYLVSERMIVRTLPFRKDLSYVRMICRTHNSGINKQFLNQIYNNFEDYFSH